VRPIAPFAVSPEASAHAIGTQERVEVDAQHRLSPGTNSNVGAMMSREPWYAFIDGPRDAKGVRIGFSSLPAASLWFLITFVITGGLVTALAVGIFALKADAAALGFLVPLAVCAGPIATASSIACFHTAQDLVEMILRPQQHH